MPCVIVALGSSFVLLLAARFLTALATGAFWAVANMVAARAAGPAASSRALGVVGSGAMLGNVVGVPLGAFAGQLTCWLAGTVLGARGLRRGLHAADRPLCPARWLRPPGGVDPVRAVRPAFRPPVAGAAGDLPALRLSRADGRAGRPARALRARRQPGADLWPSASQARPPPWGRIAGGVNQRTRVTVISDGAVGLLAVLAAKRLGAEQIILMGRHQARTGLGRKFGATDVVSARGEEGIAQVRELTGGHGTHVVLEAVGTMPAYQQAVGAVRPGGVISRVGVPQYEDAPIGFDSLFARNIRLAGGPAPARAYIEELMPGILGGTIEPGKVFDITSSSTASPTATRTWPIARASRSSSSPDLPDPERGRASPTLLSTIADTSIDAGPARLVRQVGQLRPLGVPGQGEQPERYQSTRRCR